MSRLKIVNTSLLSSDFKADAPVAIIVPSRKKWGEDSTSPSPSGPEHSQRAYPLAEYRRRARKHLRSNRQSDDLLLLLRDSRPIKLSRSFDCRVDNHPLVVWRCQYMASSNSSSDTPRSRRKSRSASAASMWPRRQFCDMAWGAARQRSIDPLRLLK